MTLKSISNLQSYFFFPKIFSVDSSTSFLSKTLWHLSSSLAGNNCINSSGSNQFLLTQVLRAITISINKCCFLNFEYVFLFFDKTRKKKTIDLHELVPPCFSKQVKDFTCITSTQLGFDSYIYIQLHACVLQCLVLKGGVKYYLIMGTQNVPYQVVYYVN